MLIDYTCEVCGKKGSRRYTYGKVPYHFFCSIPCQNEWQKTRQDIVDKNRDPAFRKKVSTGLKRRKQLLGDNYHSAETKEKIGMATVEHWNSYDDDTRNKMLQVLRDNATARRTYGDYDGRWNALSAEIRKSGTCHRCGQRERLAVHHIVPLSQGGETNRDNLITLCFSCHRIVEHQTKNLYDIVSDWVVVQLLVKERLYCL